MLHQPLPTAPLNHRLLFLQNGSIFDGFGGIEYYLDDFESLCAEIHGRDNVWAVIPRRAPGEPAAPAYQVTFVPRVSRGLRHKLSNRLSLSYFRAARAAIQKFRPTLLVNGHVALGPMTYALSRLERIPYLTIVYGIECWGDMWPQDELCLKSSAGIISISHWTQKVLMERGYPEAQIKIVQPRLATAYETRQYPERKRPPDSPLVLLTVSRLDTAEQYKGHDHVLEAIARLRQAEPQLALRYIIQGDGTDRPRLEALVERYQLQNLVEFRQAVKRRETLDALFEEADLYVMPSRYGRWDKRWRGEGFGIVYLEAAAFGLPSVAYRCGGATDIIRDRVNGMLVEPDNVESLARVLAHLARDRELVRQMGRRAYDMVMTNFTRPAISRQIIQALASYPIERP